MAKTPQTKTKKKKRITNSTKSKSAVLLSESECTCCPNCIGKAAGTMGYCEDDSCVDIDPVDYVGILVIDKNASPGSIINWVRPQNIPVAFLQELTTAIGLAMTTGQIAAFAAMLKPYICPCGDEGSGSG